MRRFSERLNVGAAQDVVQSTDSEPAVSIRFKHDGVAPVLVCVTVIVRQQIDQLAAITGVVCSQAKADLAWFRHEVMQEEHGIVAPLILHGQYAGSPEQNEGEVPPSDFGNLFAHANNALHPIEERVRISALCGDIDLLKAIGAV